MNDRVSAELIRAAMKRRTSLAEVRRFKPFGDCFHSQHILKQFKRQAVHLNHAALSPCMCQRHNTLNNLRHFLPELRLKIQFKHALNQTTDVVTEHLAHGFVNLRRVRLAVQALAKLAF